MRRTEKLPPASLIEKLYMNDDATIEPIQYKDFQELDNALHDMLRLMAFAISEDIEKGRIAYGELDEAMSERDGYIHIDGYIKGFKMAIKLMGVDE